jgi:hypothetical protein
MVPYQAVFLELNEQSAHIEQLDEKDDDEAKACHNQYLLQVLEISQRNFPLHCGNEQSKEGE